MGKKLSELKPGQKAIIKELADSENQIKLLEMGCIPGEEIRLEQVAPFGDPVSVYVSGYTLSLRISEADQIIVNEITDL